MCVCKCIKQIHKALPPSSSPPLPLTLLFLALSIKSSSPMKKRLCGVTGVCVCWWVGDKKGNAEQFNLCTQQIKRTACTNQKLAKVLDSSEPNSVLNIYTGPVAPCLLFFCCETAWVLGFLLWTSCPHMTLICNNLLRSLISLNGSCLVAHQERISIREAVGVVVKAHIWNTQQPSIRLLHLLTYKV